MQITPFSYYVNILIYIYIYIIQSIKKKNNSNLKKRKFQKFQKIILE
jgi:hypothetical protein